MQIDHVNHYFHKNRYNSLTVLDWRTSGFFFYFKLSKLLHITYYQYSNCKKQNLWLFRDLRSSEFASNHRRGVCICTLKIHINFPYSKLYFIIGFRTTSYCIVIISSLFVWLFWTIFSFFFLLFFILLSYFLYHLNLWLANITNF